MAAFSHNTLPLDLEHRCRSINTLVVIQPDVFLYLWKGILTGRKCKRTAWLFVFAILALTCKEEIPAVIAMFGLWSSVFQQRWRSGLILVVLSMAWVGMVLLVYRFASPTGRPLLASRYAYLGNGPLQIIHYFLRHPRAVISQHLLEATHRRYLRILLAPAGYLPLLVPWILMLASPSIALNLLSSDRNQYLGVFQYNAEIVPVVMVATIEAIALMIQIVQWLVQRLRAGYEDFTNGALPFSRAFAWPHVTQHDRIAQQLLAMIPSWASVFAQSSLVPHLSRAGE